MSEAKHDLPKGLRLSRSEEGLNHRYEPFAT
jgi:hypothetical protein